MASPNTFSGLHSTIALTGAEFSPATPNGANDPGLENQGAVRHTTPIRKVNMTTMHWILIAAALVAIWYFFFRTPSSAT
jgi:hypothetical protein